MPISPLKKTLFEEKNFLFPFMNLSNHNFNKSLFNAFFRITSDHTFMFTTNLLLILILIFSYEKKNIIHCICTN